MSPVTSLSTAAREMAVRPSASPRAGQARGSRIITELIRLVVVVIATMGSVQVMSSGGLESTTQLGPAAGLATRWGLSEDSALLLAVVLGAAIGYVVGGVLGRFSVHRMDDVESNLAAYSAGELAAGVVGAFSGLVLGVGITWPVLLFGGRTFTVPIALLLVLLLMGTGLRVGIRRGGDLLRSLGASGRLSTATPTRGSRAKLVDTSALVDGRVLDVCRGGFFDGVLVLPQFVLYELQGLADAGDEERRRRGQRGLDVLTGLQRAAGVTLEVTERDYPDIAAVDAKLVQMARDRGASLITVDANLERVAEVQGVKVLNLHTLAETLRPPVLPGDELQVALVKRGKERGQGVGYLADGTMVVVEAGADRIGATVMTEVTSILSNAHGRMVFATIADDRHTTSLAVSA